MRKKVLRFLVPVLAFCLFATSVMAQAVGGSGLSASDPVRIERASVLPAGKAGFEAGLALEVEREVAGSEYDNIRLAPLGVRFGLGEGVEVGAFVAASSNDADNDVFPDESGVEGLTVFGKIALNDYAALSAGLTVGGDDDVFPYPNDGVDVFANLALQRPLGGGKILGEFGYTAQGGDFDFNDYLNYGVGYAFPLNQQLGLSLELVGEEGQVGTGFENTLDLVAGANVLLGPMMRLAPYLSIGVNDASPDFAVGALFEIRP